MQAIETATNDMMAQWRATGGAFARADAPLEAAADDGLAATGPTRVYVNGTCGSNDDGLRAAASSIGLGCEGGGLQGGGWTFYPRCA